MKFTKQGNRQKGFLKIVYFHFENNARWYAFIVIFIISFFFHFTNLNNFDFPNRYYAAADISMLKSWHNFFFLAAEPGGVVSVDKPPIGLWVQTICIYFLGTTSFAMLLPQLISGILITITIFLLVVNRFGVMSATIASISYLFTPISLVTARNTTMDSLLNLFLILAIWLIIIASEKNSFPYLIYGFMLIGVGFNIKMFQAYIPLPAIYVCYFHNNPSTTIKKIKNLMIASLILLIMSFSWIVLVELTPVSLRPYVGGSTNNSMLNLVFAYNGYYRFTGILYPGTGIPGIFRLFSTPLNKEASWILPFSLISLFLFIYQRNHKKSAIELNQAFLLAGGWLISCLIVFSSSSFMHQYYLSMLSIPLSLIVGISFSKYRQFLEKKETYTNIIFYFAIGMTIGFQLNTELSYIKWQWWFYFPIFLFITSLLLFLFCRNLGIVYFGTFLAFITILFTPFIWSLLTIFYPGPDQMSPSAYNGNSIVTIKGSSFYFRDNLLKFLQENTKNNYYLIAVPSAREGADFVIATGRPVLYLGGFLGEDKILSLAELKKFITNNKIRFVLWNRAEFENKLSFSGPYDYTNYLMMKCQPLTVYDEQFNSRIKYENKFDSMLLQSPQPELVLYDCVKQNR